MKVLCVGDVHWSQHSSIVRSRGENYSTRLENLLRSLNWAETVAWENGCSVIIYMGDFFDSTQLNSEEISALRELRWAPIPHLFITGNHETNVSSLEYSTCEVFSLCPNARIINTPEYYHIEDTDVEFCFLPYILERDRKPLHEYFPVKTEKRIIFSHNDLKDVQYGQFVSTEGFSIDEIESHCDLFINGHIHNCTYVTNKILNTGNLTGQNFTEDATKYGHFVELIDTSTLSIQFIQNPYAFNFVKTHVTNNMFSTNDIPFTLNNVVLTIHVDSFETGAIVRNYCDTANNIVAYRIVVDGQSPSMTVDSGIQTVDAVDHLKQFEQYVLTNIGDNTVIREELFNVMR